MKYMKQKHYEDIQLQLLLSINTKSGLKPLFLKLKEFTSPQPSGLCTTLTSKTTS